MADLTQAERRAALLERLADRAAADDVEPVRSLAATLIEAVAANA